MATAGHVDHGKSALVKALTGTDPDRLPEEKLRGITIDLGFAHFELPAPSDSIWFSIGIVDVPGHEDFVKNMVAGVGSIDLALMVVAADDGWMPQTEEHLQILNYLGVTRAVVALTKIDLARDREQELKAAIRQKLSHTPLAHAPVVSTSTVENAGVEALKGALTEVLSRTPPPRDMGKPRLAVDRVFTLRGIGTVATGTLSGGRLNQGQDVVIQPSGIATRVRGLQSHNADVPSCGPGTRTALNLADVEVGGKASSAAGAKAVRRGDVITIVELGAAGTTLHVLIERSGRLSDSKGGGGRPLKNGGLVRVHHGSGNHPARVSFPDREELGPGEQALAQLRFEAPLFALGGDRFIIRDWAEQQTLGGGIVLDPEPPPRSFRGASQRRLLEERIKGPHDVRIWVRTQLARDGAVRKSGLLCKSVFGMDEIMNAVSELVSAGKLVAPGELVADAPWWNSLLEQAVLAIDDHHRRHPEQLGLPVSQLRAALQGCLIVPEVFDELVHALSAQGFRQSGVVIKRNSHRPGLPPHLEAAGARVRSALAAKPLEPPSRKELAPDAASQQALRFLRDTGEVIELSEEIVLLNESFAKMKREITGFLQRKGSATVSDLRQMLGTTRRIMMPLLERLDREGVTVRQGDQRVLGKNP